VVGKGVTKEQMTAERGDERRVDLGTGGAVERTMYDSGDQKQESK